MATVATLIAGILAGLVLLAYIWVLEARLRAQGARRIKLALNTAIRDRVFGKVALRVTPLELRLCPVRSFDRMR